MKIRVSINSRGVIAIPARLRKALGIQADDLLIAETTTEVLLLRPAVKLPVEIYSDGRVTEFELEKLLAGITPDNQHGEIVFGPAVGKEAF